MKITTCKLHDLSDNLDSESGHSSDLDSNRHEGFTVGKGKFMYWYIIWSKNGNAYIFRLDGSDLIRRWVPGDIEVTIHFK